MSLHHLDKDGYVLIVRGEPKNGIRRKLEHIEVAEKALGRALPALAVVHHWDENRANNKPSNLLICPDRAYHNLIHRRTRAYDECGHADWRKCQWCCKYDPPEKLKLSAKVAYHRECNNANAQRMRDKKRRIGS
jgi:hypothetical protein